MHSDPEVARSAGFERPILHGLSTIGMAGHALDRMAARNDRALYSISSRMTAPVFPGQILRLEVWEEGDGHLFHVVNPEGQVVLSRGRAGYRQIGGMG